MVALAPMPESADVFRRNLRELPAFRALLRAVETRFYAGLELPEPTLDLGCGDGHFTSAAFDAPLAVGVDADFDAVRAARTRAGVYRGLMQSGGERLPFGDASFGSAISNSVLEHIPGLASALRETSRVLRPGAPFVFTVPSKYFREFLSVRRALFRLGLRSVARAYERWFDRISRHEHYHSPEEWRVLLEHAGFEVEQRRYYFSERAMRALEWGHYLGLPAVVSRKLTGHWILVPTDANLWLTERLLRRFFEEPLPARGAYLFIVARRFVE
ncbi:MAG: class I SAM-dependent methyltransferase [Anaerolineales bacterium]|nr:class I SAM-dependent methyltransferase [Anaerolineales bacterium]MDP7545170.1 class I SAM-dependent methyltransferase [Anaerolineales bacterium]MDP7643456.1 class I SAM-dependent methyltransferase [Anaerolineales bacterium]HJL70470.1 class I SAM-dependent methyltransferase [Anaerolineales bacterium]HJN41326.1 class I SAM-dependent methyltransferase [Anaerolineales bacterium]